jgi:hypothetical protein
MVLAWALTAGRLAAQQDTPRAIIERAIEAHGGEERLARNRADRVRVRGSLFLPTARVPFVAETMVQLPKHFKTIVELTTAAGRKHTFVYLIQGDKITFTDDGVPREIDAAALAEVRSKMYLDQAVRLVPLLRGRNYQLAPTEEVRVNERPAVGVCVTVRGVPQVELRLYFDKTLGLLVKTEHLLTDGAGKKVREEQYYGDFKDESGYKRPFRVIAYRDGKKVMEADVADVKSYERIDESEFTRP